MASQERFGANSPLPLKGPGTVIRTSVIQSTVARCSISTTTTRKNAQGKVAPVGPKQQYVEGLVSLAICSHVYLSFCGWL